MNTGLIWDVMPAPFVLPYYAYLDHGSIVSVKDLYSFLDYYNRWCHNSRIPVTPVPLPSRSHCQSA